MKGSGPTNVGVCRLCKRTGELQDSHYLPRALFLKVIQSRQPHISAPVVVDAGNQSAVYTNYQPTQHLLCASCETRFSIRGEDPVARCCYDNEETFPLRDALDGQEPSGRWDGGAFYRGSDVDGVVDVPSLAHFALGVYWRGAAASWRHPYHRFHQALGRKYSEDFRRYLLGEAPFPQKTLLNLYVDFDRPSHTGLAPPEPHRIKSPNLKGWQHTFMVPGIKFELFMGGNIAEVATKAGRTSEVAILQWSFKRSPSYRSAVELVVRASPKRKLARELGENTAQPALAPDGSRRR